MPETPAPLPDRDPVFGPDLFADFKPSDPAAVVTQINLNVLSTTEAQALLAQANQAIADRQKANDVFGALQVFATFAEKFAFL